MKKDDFKCKSCGGMMRFDPKSKALKCENCSTEEHLPSTLTWKRHALHEYDDRVKYEEKEVISVIECNSCGATIEMNSHETSGKCPYCDSNIVMSDKAVSVLEPDGMRPFSIDRKEVENIFSNWVKKRWFAPNALKNLYQSGKVMGIYLPYWSFDNHADCDYTAEGGKERTETYEDDEGKTQTRTVTDWYTVRGSISNDFKNVIMRASKSLKDSLLKSLEGFNLERTISFNSGYLSGYNSEIFKVPMWDGYAEVKPIMKDKLVEMIKADVLKSYDKVGEIEYDVYWSNEFYRLLMLPVYSMSYSFNGKAYQVVINGENGKTVGEYPKSPVKIAIAVILVIILIIGIVYMFKK